MKASLLCASCASVSLIIEGKEWGYSWGGWCFNKNYDGDNQSFLSEDSVIPRWAQIASVVWQQMTRSDSHLRCFLCCVHYLLISGLWINCAAIRGGHCEHDSLVISGFYCKYPGTRTIMLHMLANRHFYLHPATSTNTIITWINAHPAWWFADVWERRLLWRHNVVEVQVLRCCSPFFFFCTLSTASRALLPLYIIWMTQMTATSWNTV